MRHEPTKAERARRRKTALLSWARVNKFGPLHMVPDNAEHWRQILAVAADLGLETTPDDWSPAGGQVEDTDGGPPGDPERAKQAMASLGPSTPADTMKMRIYGYRHHGVPWQAEWGPNPDGDDDKGGDQ